MIRAVLDKLLIYKTVISRPDGGAKSIEEIGGVAPESQKTAENSEITRK